MPENSKHVLSNALRALQKPLVHIQCIINESRCYAVCQQNDYRFGKGKVQVFQLFFSSGSRLPRGLLATEREASPGRPKASCSCSAAP